MFPSTFTIEASDEEFRPEIETGISIVAKNLFPASVLTSSKLVRSGRTSEQIQAEPAQVGGTNVGSSIGILNQHSTRTHFSSASANFSPALTRPAKEMLFEDLSERSGQDDEKATMQNAPLVFTQDQIPCQFHTALGSTPEACNVVTVGARKKNASYDCDQEVKNSTDRHQSEYEPDFHEETSQSYGDDGVENWNEQVTSMPAHLQHHITRPVTANSRTHNRSAHERPSLESRIAQQMSFHPSTWSVPGVCDWLEYIGLGQYRKRFLHHSINGDLLLRLTSEKLKTEIGIGPLGHREGLLQAIEDLANHYNSQEGAGLAEASIQNRNSVTESLEGSRGTFPSLGQAWKGSANVMRTFEQRQRLVKELQRAEAREAQRRRVSEDAMRMLDLATQEVRKLQAMISELDKSMGWSNSHSVERSLDTNGVLPWHPAGATLKTATSSSGQAPSPKMSKVSRSIMEGHAGSFLERLQTDIENRQAKLKMARCTSSRHYKGAAHDQEVKDVKYIRDTVVERNSELHDLLRAGSAAEIEEGLDDVADMFQHDLDLSNRQVETVKKAKGVAAKAARLANYIRSAHFMERFQQDLATRETRQRELQKQWYVLEGGRNSVEQETRDAAEAKAMFELLGWPQADLEVKPGDTSCPLDGYISGLLNRVWAARKAEECGKEIDWDLFRKDGLNDMQERKCQELLDAHAKQQQKLEQEATQRQAAMRAGKFQILSRGQPAPPELPAVKDYLQETVLLLARCRDDEIEMLERLSGFKKLINTYRAIRAKKFVDFTRMDLEQRKAKAEQLTNRLYPSNRKVLRKEHFDKFLDRLKEDTARRMQNKAEIADKFRQEALANLSKTAPKHTRRRPQSATV